MLKLESFETLIRNTREVSKCGAGERWRRLTGGVRNEEVLHRVHED
jgi:hypothetical protein